MRILPRITKTQRLEALHSKPLNDYECEGGLLHKALIACLEWNGTDPLEPIQTEEIEVDLAGEVIDPAEAETFKREIEYAAAELTKLGWTTRIEFFADAEPFVRVHELYIS